MPSINVIERSISDYIIAYGSYCFEDLKNLTEFGSIDYKIENVSTKILENNIVVSIYAPTIINFASSSYELSNFRIGIDNYRLYDVHAFNDFFIKNQLEDKYTICLSCIIDRGTENNLSIDVTNVGNRTFIFTVGYNDTKTDSLHKFTFANKYKQISCKNLPLDAEDYLLNRVTEDCAKQEIESYNYSFFVEDVGILQAYVGIPFTTKIIAKGLNLEYLDYTDLFEIDSKTGVISFIPTESQEGEHIALISVKDHFGNEDIKEMTINISK